jgi:hypothetical protein
MQGLRRVFRSLQAIPYTITMTRARVLGTFYSIRSMFRR